MTLIRTPLGSRLLGLPALLVLLIGFSETTALGCAGFQAQDPWDHHAAATLDVDQTLDHPTALGVIALVNDPAVDAWFLDEGVGIDARAADRIVAHRQGPDGLDGTADDERYTTIMALDAVAYVGDATLSLLGDAAWELGYVPVLVLEGVAFSEGGLEATLLLANGATFDELDTGAGLDKRAAEALLGGRPYSDMSEVAARPYVGPATLRLMLRFADHWLDAAE